MAVEFGHSKKSLLIEIISTFWDCSFSFTIKLKNVKKSSSLTFTDDSQSPVITLKTWLFEQHLLTFNRDFNKDCKETSCSFSFLSSFDLQCTSIGTFWGVNCSWRISIQDVFCEYKKKKKDKNRKSWKRREFTLF